MTKPTLTHEEIESHIPLVMSVVGRMLTGDKRLLLVRDDMVASGYEGLVLAARKFDPANYKNKFDTFAWWYIRGKILDMLKKEIRHFQVRKFDDLKFSDGDGDGELSWEDIYAGDCTASDAILPDDLFEDEQLIVRRTIEGYSQAEINRELVELGFCDKFKEIREDVYKKFIENAVEVRGHFTPNTL